MNRKLIVTLLRKDIQELDMITIGFMEMTEYPSAIINLAQRKISDIQSYIQQLEDLKIEVETVVVPENTQPEIDIVETVEEKIEAEPEEESVIEIETVQERVEFTEVTESTESVEIIASEEVDEQSANSGSVDIPENYEVKEVTEVISSTITETKTTVEDTKKMILAEKMSLQSTSRNDSLSKADNSISSTLANKKIGDIKQAINIGDRFRFQRELFRGNGEDMNKTLNYINQLATFGEVKSFLQSKYGWDASNVTAEDFYQIVRRRFF